MAQHEARVAVQRRAGGAETHCTGSARVAYLKRIATKTFVCVVDRGDQRCDEYLAQRTGRRFRVRLYRRDVECIVPVG